MTPFQICGTGECAAHIASTCVVFQPHLRRRVPDAPATGGVEHDIELACDCACDFGGMVEPAFTDPLRVQWHCDQAIGPRTGCRCFCHTRGQHGSDDQLPFVFQAGDQAVKRINVGQSGNGAIECRRTLEACTTRLTGGCGRCALRALGLAVPGQIDLASGTQVLVVRGGATQQAVSWECQIKK